MNNKIYILIILFFSMFSIIGYAQATSSAYGIKETKSLDIATGFQNNISANTNYSALFYFNNTTFIDNIDSIISFYGLFVYEKKLAFPQTWNFYVNGTECPNSPYTTVMGSTQLIIIACFSESQIMQVKVNATTFSVFNFTYRTDKDTDNLFRRVFLTYINDPMIEPVNISNYSINQILNNITIGINDIPLNVWTYTTRTLTAFDFLVNITQNALDNIAYSVWNYGTYVNRTVTVSNVNVTLDVNTTNITLDLSDKAILKIVETLCFNYPKICENKAWWQ